MKLRIEVAEDSCDEVVIKCKSVTPEVMRLQNAFAMATGGKADMTLTIGDTEYFVPINDILFFETDGDKVTAHSAERMYYSDKKLYELERALPPYFIRVSKSAILNSSKVSSISKSITGSGEVLFYFSNKKVYVSRMYYKQLKDLIYETRLSK